MSYAEGSGWAIEINRHPISGGYQVYVEEIDFRPSVPVKRTRVAGNKFGYARRETAERRADREAQKLEDAES